ncbi:MAG TPA: ABC transporter permease [Bryobacteraceae bacterium]|nr:ABC transporter permease [Bryobacteraceae bacterium]
MLRDVLFLLSRDLSHLLRRRETLLWTFVMPVIFFYFIGNVSGGFGRLDEPDPIAMVKPADAGFLADELAARLEQRNFRVVDQPDFFRAIHLPPGFTASVLAGRAPQVEFVRHGTGINTEYEQTRVSRAVYALAGDVATLRAEGIAPSPEAFARLAQHPRRIALRATSAGKRQVAPIGFEQAVPGMLVMFTMLVLLNVGGITILAERRQGILRRLASAPISRGAVVLAKWGARMSLGFVQILFAMLTGTVLFKVHWGDHLGAILALLAAYAGMTAVFGLLLGNFARIEGQVVGMGVIVSNVLAALGGCWWPIEITPPWAQKIALVFPTGWAMDALHKLMSFGDSPAAVVPHVAAFLTVAVIAGWVLTRKFRFE